jgi:hypothetical protein
MCSLTPERTARDVIHHARGNAAEVGHFEAGLPVLRELERAGHGPGWLADGALNNGSWNRLAVVALQHRLRIEQVHLARTAAHVEHDDAPGAGSEVRQPRPKIEDGPCGPGRHRHQRVQGQRADATGEAAQRFAPRQRRRRVTAT